MGRQAVTAGPGLSDNNRDGKVDVGWVAEVKLRTWGGEVTVQGGLVETTLSLSLSLSHSPVKREQREDGVWVCPEAQRQTQNDMA